MQDKTIHKRTLKGTIDGRLVIATAEVHSIGEQKPYFSTTTDSGAALDTIRKAFPELSYLVDLHLSDENGQPMHCAANAEYFAKNREATKLAHHLRISEEEASRITDRIDGTKLDPKDVIQQELVNLFPIYKEQAQKAIAFLSEDGDYLSGELSFDPDSPAALIDGDSFNVTVKGNYISYGNREWVIFDDAETAGEAAREYWKDMAEHDPKEFTCMVGEETLVSWALGQSAGPGSTAVRSLEEWLDLWLNTPEEHFASYDGEEVEILVNEACLEELGISETGLDKPSEESPWFKVTAYRHN